MMSYTVYLSLFVCITTCIFKSVTAGSRDIKIIKELPSIGYSLIGDDKNSWDYVKPRMKPANFSGPEHLKELQGSCFTFRSDKYEYGFCPFFNFTQEDKQVYYEPYRGILGMWGEWLIKDNQFSAMWMVEGNVCGGGRHRTTMVTLKCGRVNALKNVTEPERCHYKTTFETPLVCGQNSLLVYPRLSIENRKLWDFAFTEKEDGLLTHKGYDESLRRIFLNEGFLLAPEVKEKLMQEAEKERLILKKTCEENLADLQTQIADLQEQLRVKDEYILTLDNKS